MSTDQRIKLLWEFRGPASGKTAEHHQIHLNDFVQKHSLQPGTTGVDTVSDVHAVAFLIIVQDDLPLVKTTLRPQRALLVD